MRLRLLSRASDLARLQAHAVARAIESSWPGVQIVFLSRSAKGDRDVTKPLASLPDKGAFTADLSQALVSDDADIVVHSWKDLPLESAPGTTVAATLERADPRDVLLVRRDAIRDRLARLEVLTSSPRRAWLIERSVASLLPWPIETLSAVPVRGNVPTRLAKLMTGEAPALLVAKAALDRLLDQSHPFDATRRRVRAALDECRWMVLPISECPTAPAQGALAIEVSAARQDLCARVAALRDVAAWRAVMIERRILSDYGGGCHQAVGATCLTREFGDVLSVRGKLPTGGEQVTWQLATGRPLPPRTAERAIWPRPDERHRAVRRPLEVAAPSDTAGLWITRADALPESWRLTDRQLVWTAGVQTWQRLAARGVWVNGCADALGDTERPAIDLLAGESPRWRRLTHTEALVPDALPTYVVDEPLPDDLPERSHFFWTSGSLFRRAMERWPVLAERWHGCGPGHTRTVVAEALPNRDRVGVWLDWHSWYQDVLA
jgi:hydroxymethylbilane synthase